MGLTLTHRFVCDLREAVNGEVAHLLGKMALTASHAVQLIVIDENGTEIGVDTTAEASDLLQHLFKRRSDQLITEAK